MAYPPPPYKDAVAGNFVAGEAIVGTWWAYPPTAQLGLQGVPPGLVIVNADADVTITPPTAALGLAGVLPSLTIFQTIDVPLSKLGLSAGGVTIEFVGHLWIYEDTETDLDLDPNACGELVLAAAPVRELDLEGATCL